VAVVATLSKDYDLDYIWKQVDRRPAKDAASYYIQASESGGEPSGRWWGPGAKALGLEPPGWPNPSGSAPPGNKRPACGSAMAIPLCWPSTTSTPGSPAATRSS
jgi:hypothetical protein